MIEKLVDLLLAADGFIAGGICLLGMAVLVDPCPIYKHAKLQRWILGILGISIFWYGVQPDWIIIGSHRAAALVICAASTALMLTTVLQAYHCQKQARLPEIPDGAVPQDRARGRGPVAAA